MEIVKLMRVDLETIMLAKLSETYLLKTRTVNFSKEVSEVTLQTAFNYDLAASIKIIIKESNSIRVK